eukprot:611470-Prorocentrum_minimum.AAC.1
MERLRSAKQLAEAKLGGVDLKKMKDDNGACPSPGKRVPRSGALSQSRASVRGRLANHVCPSRAFRQSCASVRGRLANHVCPSRAFRQSRAHHAHHQGAFSASRASVWHKHHAACLERPAVVTQPSYGLHLSFSNGSYMTFVSRHRVAHLKKASPNLKQVFPNLKQVFPNLKQRFSNPQAGVVQRMAAEHMEEVARYKQEVSALESRLKWYSENQEMVDGIVATARAQAERAAMAEAKLHKVEDDMRQLHMDLGPEKRGKVKPTMSGQAQVRIKELEAKVNNITIGTPLRFVLRVIPMLTRGRCQGRWPLDEANYTLARVDGHLMRRITPSPGSMAT